jgi:farnesyl diphosphate synthase
MDYNVPGGKLNRGLSVVDSVAILKGRELTDTEYFKAAVLGWSVEWVRFVFSFSLPTTVPGLIAAQAPSVLSRFR